MELERIESDQIGFHATSPGPFGERRIVYTDYTASGRPLKSIEDYIEREVLPLYANTHTGTSYCSRQTTYFREEARDIIRNSVNASDNDCVIFAGNGCTGAVHKLIHVLELRNASSPLVVFVGPFEHHSNLLPWRELGAKIVWVKEGDNGSFDLNDLEEKLKLYTTAEVQLIGAFNAASNLTGVITDTVPVSCLIHRYGGVVFWDYASSAPYLKIDMNPIVIRKHAELAYKDAVYFSMHKFVGGPDSPGVLVAKKHLFKNSTPDHCGGGTVFFVTPSSHHYFKTIEMREEGGTPSIIGSIRAGLAMQLKQTIGPVTIATKEDEISNYVYSKWEKIPELYVVGPPPQNVSRLPIFSLIFLHPPSGKYLHHNFICTLLSDLFGIQARGGCSCAGPYAQGLLGINESLADKYRCIIMRDSRLLQAHMKVSHELSEREVLRPGMTRLSFPYFMSQEAIDYVVKAVSMIASHSWKLLPQYQFNPETGLFRYSDYHPESERKCLSAFVYQHNPSGTPTSITPPNYEETLKIAEKIFDSANKVKTDSKRLGDQSLFLSEEAEDLRWFLLPSEAQEYLLGETTPTITPPPFTPKIYKECHSDTEQVEEIEREKIKSPVIKFHHPPKSILKPTMEAIVEYSMIENGDRILVCLSGGKDSLSLLHTLKQYQYIARSQGVFFELGAVTVDPKSSAYNPRPLIPYLNSLGVPYFFEEQGIMDQAAAINNLESICSFCSRMKRGRLYACARREGYNVLALGQHLDDLAESLLMSIFHNGFLRTMKANYTVQKGDLRIIRPFVYVREKELNLFAKQAPLPVIPENCPACFTAPKERERMKQLLAAQELLFPNLFHSLCSAMKPLMSRKLVQEDNDEEVVQIIFNNST